MNLKAAFRKKFLVYTSILKVTFQSYVNQHGEVKLLFTSIPSFIHPYIYLVSNWPRFSKARK